MAESTLNLSKSELEIEVSVHAGFGPTVDTDSLSAEQLRRIASSIKTGLSYFYFPAGYEWSFLKPVASLTLAEGETVVALPDDFNWLNDKIIPASSGGSSQFAIQVRGEGEVLELFAGLPNVTARPAVCCVQALRGTQVNESSRSQLLIYPTADQDYTLQVPYSIIPEMLTDQAPYFYGGANHAQTIKAACKFAYSEAWDGMAMSQEFGQSFQRMMQMSIEQDRKRKPSNFGYNGDGSDGTYPSMRHGVSWAAVSINGVVPGFAG